VVKDLNFFNSLVKILTFKGHFKMSLSMNDTYLHLISPSVLVEDGNAEVAKSIYSCLLYCSVESKEYWRALKFFRQIERTGPPSEKDLLNVCRSSIAREDWKSLISILSKEFPAVVLKKSIGMAVESLLHNGQEELISDFLGSAKSISTVEQVLLGLRILENRTNFLQSILNRSDLSQTAISIVAQSMDNWVFSETDPDPIATVRSMLASKDKSCSMPLVNALLRASKSVTRLLFCALLGDIRSAVYADNFRADDNVYASLYRLAPSVSDVMDVYNLMEEQQRVDNQLKPGDKMLRAILHRVAKESRDSTAWVVACRVSGNFKNLSEKAVSLLITILVDSPSLGGDKSIQYEKIFELLDQRRSFNQRLFVLAIDGAIHQGNSKWTNRLFQLMVDRVRPEERKQTLTECVDRILREAKGDMFSQALELALLNRVPLKEGTVVAGVANCKTALKVLTKYKYRLPM
jgi:hypothetical protein